MDKPTSAQDFFATRRYNDNSPEQHTRATSGESAVDRPHRTPSQDCRRLGSSPLLAKMDKTLKVPNFKLDFKE